MKVAIKTEGFGPVHAWKKDNGFVADFMCGAGVGPMTTLHSLGAVLIDEAPASTVTCQVCIKTLLERISGGGDADEG